MTGPHPTRADQVDELFSLLADRYCRAVLAYFRTAEEETVPLWDLADEIREGDDGGRKEALAQLHHSTIPRLEDAGVIEHTRSSGLVRYRGHDELETVLAAVEEIHRRRRNDES